MEILNNSVRNMFYGVIVLVLNIPVFWSFSSFINFIKEVLSTLGL